MPIYKKNDKRILFVHIPRTGGKSIRAILQADGWAKEDIEKELISPSSSYEHQPFSSWSKLGDFDFIFTIVRNPYSRLESEARSKAVNRNSFFKWFKRQQKRSRDFRTTINDGHFTPQEKYIGGDKIKIFKFEDGHEEIVKSLIDLSILEEHAEVLHIEDGYDPTAWRTPCRWKKQIEILNRVNKMYEQDFASFNYKMIQP